MTIFQGEEKLRANASQLLPEMVQQITKRVYVLRHFGSSNSVLIVGEKSCILIDAFESSGYGQDAKEAIEKITNKPVRTIIFTHQHADHIGGGQVFSSTVKETIGRLSQVPEIKRQEKISQDSQRRAVRQFGATLSPDEALSLGLGPVYPPKGMVKPLPINRWVRDEVETLSIDNIRLQIIAAPGETDEGAAVWLPDEQVFCGGDNFYACWPNLSALRGSTYRDVDRWVDSLGKYLQYPVKYFVPGHGDVIVGYDKFLEILGNYHDAIEWVLDKTLEGINEGKTPDELVECINLPEKWAKLPYLQEYYGTVAWSVRGIYDGYVGWFDGNPTHIDMLPKSEHAKKIIDLMGGVKNVARAITDAIAQTDMQWAMELCDLLLDAGDIETQAKEWKAEACKYLARMQVSANARHYYLTCAKELIE